jgi:hypothetical protein
MLKEVILAATFSTGSCDAYDLKYLKQLAPDIEADLANLKKALKCTMDGWLMGALSSFGPIANREPIELQSVYRFKCVKATEPKDFLDWIAKQSDASVKELIELADKHTDKKSLITSQNELYPEYLTPEQAYERIFQAKHIDKKTTKKA